MLNRHLCNKDVDINTDRQNVITIELRGSKLSTADFVKLKAEY